MNVERTFFLGLGAGLGAGWALGIIFAPRSGKETQDLISQTAHEGFDKVLSTGQKAVCQMKDAASNTVAQVEGVLDAAKGGYDGQKAWVAETADVQNLEK